MKSHLSFLKNNRFSDYYIVITDNEDKNEWTKNMNV